MADVVFPGKASGKLGEEFLPANFDLVLYKGDYFPFTVTLRNPVTSGGTPLNLTGYSARAQIRTGFGEATVYEFAVGIPNPSNGVVSIVLPSMVSDSIAPGSYVWDFQVSDSTGNTRTYLAGDVTVYDEVTK